MANLVGGLIAIVTAVLFLGSLAVALNSVALWVVILIGVAMMIADFVGTLRPRAD